MCLADEESTYKSFAHNVGSLSFSTAFSGVGAPETARLNLAQFFVSTITGLSLTTFALAPLFCIEWDHACQGELLCGPHPPQCLFTNMLDFINPLVKQRVEQNIRTWSVDKLKELVTTGELAIDSAYCVIHKTVCKLVRAMMHLAGPPCTDWSSQWCARQREEGVTILCTLLWISQRLLMRELLCIHENVAAFDLSLLADTLGHMYILFSSLINLEQLGWPVKRCRRFTILVRRDILSEALCTWEVFTESCRRLCNCSWKGFVIAAHSAIEDDMRWAEGRKESLSNCKSKKQLINAITIECQLFSLSKSDIAGVVKLAQESRYTMSLNAAEARRLYRYRQLCMMRVGTLEHMVCLVSQDPDDHPQFSTGPVMSTLIKSASICWAEGGINRPLTGVELLGAQGFITDPSFSFNGATSSFLINRDRNRVGQVNQAGNAMPVQMVGMAMLWASVAVQRQRLVRVSSNLSLFARMHRAIRSSGFENGQDDPDA